MTIYAQPRDAPLLYKVNISNMTVWENHMGISLWMAEHNIEEEYVEHRIHDSFAVPYRTYWFASEEDAMMFALKWK